MTLGEAIAYARDVKGWSLRSLQEKSGIHNAVISQIETGHIKDPSFRTIVKLAKALGLKLDRLAKCEERKE